MKSVFISQMWIATLHAPRWKCWLARLFGRRFEVRDGHTIVRGARWMGVTYIFEIREIPT